MWEHQRRYGKGQLARGGEEAIRQVVHSQFRSVYLEAKPNVNTAEMMVISHHKVCQSWTNLNSSHLNIWLLLYTLLPKRT